MPKTVDRKASVPRERDIKIYVANRVERISQRRLANQFGVRQPRIAQICRAVEPWAKGQLTAEHPERLTEKLLVHARLEQLYREAMRGWRESLKDRTRRVTKRSGTAKVEVITTETQNGDPAMVGMAMKALRGIRELSGLDGVEPLAQHSSTMDTAEEKVGNRSRPGGAGA
jgi:hypothetical protein